MVYLVGCAPLLPVAIRSEEAFLEHNFDGYADYRATVQALLPRRGWVRGQATAIDARALGRSVIDSAAFLTRCCCPSSPSCRKAA